MSDPGRESRVGSQIGPYRLRRLLGKGGMGPFRGPAAGTACGADPRLRRGRRAALRRHADDRRHRPAQDAQIVDIRPQVARHQGSITGALLIDPVAIADQITDRHREIVVCSVSSRRAIPAAERLGRLGYDRVHYLASGYSAWTARR